MYFLKCLFFNFLAIFFSNYILPGILVSSTKFPHFGSDLPFAFILALLNSLIYPFFKLLHSSLSAVKIGFTALIINLIIYALAKVLPIGVKISSVEGYLLAVALVTIASFLTNYLEMRHHKAKSSSSTTHPMNEPIDLPKL